MAFTIHLCYFVILHADMVFISLQGTRGPIGEAGPVGESVRQELNDS